VLVRALPANNGNECRKSSVGASYSPIDPLINRGRPPRCQRKLE